MRNKEMQSRQKRKSGVRPSAQFTRIKTSRRAVEMKLDPSTRHGTTAFMTLYIKRQSGDGNRALRLSCGANLLTAGRVRPDVWCSVGASNAAAKIRRLSLRLGINRKGLAARPARSRRR